MADRPIGPIRTNILQFVRRAPVFAVGLGRDFGKAQINWH